MVLTAKGDSMEVNEYQNLAKRTANLGKISTRANSLRLKSGYMVYEVISVEMLGVRKKKVRKNR